MTIAFHLTITGQVQGVGFRAFVIGQAQRHGLSGWVRNRRDGGVEALVCGNPAAVAAVIAECERGPRHARVDRVEREAAEWDGSLDFTARPTV